MAEAFQSFVRRRVTRRVKKATPDASERLRYTPPGWDGTTAPTSASAFPGYTERTITGSGTLSMSSGTDYYVNMGALAWSGSGRVILSGGRNVVLVGGSINHTSTTSDNGDDSIQIDGGDSGGTVHIEGLHINNMPNGFTVRTPRTVQIQNCHVVAHINQDNFSLGHPDIIQAWRGHRCAGIKVHRFSATSAFTYFADFTDEASPYSGDQTPAFWELRDVDLHAKAPSSGTLPLIGLNNWMGNPQTCVWRGDNLWIEPGWESASSQRDLGDVLRQHGEQYTPKYAGYRIYDTDGTTVLYTQAEGIASGAPGTTGKIQGHWLRYHLNVDMADIAWRWGKPTVSDGASSTGYFVPTSTVGANYVSPGYQ